MIDAYSIRTLFVVAVLICAASYGFFTCMNAQAKRDFGTMPVVAALAASAIIFLSPNIMIMHLAMLALVPVLARRTRDVATCYIVALMLIPAFPQWFVVGGLSLFNYSIHDSLAVGALLALLSRYNDRARIPIGYDVGFIMILTVSVFIALTDTSNITNVAREMTSALFTLIIPYYVVTRSLRGTTDVQHFATHLAFIGTVLGTILVFEMLKGWPIYLNLYSKTGILDGSGLYVKTRGSFIRAAGPFLESTSMAFCMVSCLLAAWLGRRSYRSLMYSTAVMAVILGGILASQSRNAFIGILVGVVAASAFRSGTWGLMRNAFLGAGAVLFVVVIAPFSSFLSELFGMQAGAAASETTDYRRRLFERGVEEFWKSPIFGDTKANVLFNLRDMRQGEGIVDFVNAYLYFALTAGGIGLALFVIGLTGPALALFRRRARLTANPTALRMGALVFGCILAQVQMLFFTGFGSRTAIFTLLTVGLVGSLLAKPRPVRASIPRLTQHDIDMTGTRIA